MPMPVSRITISRLPSAVLAGTPMRSLSGVNRAAKDGDRKSYSGTTAKVLEKQSDGTWKARMHIWNMDPES
jgi:hypothetical protein